MNRKRISRIGKYVLVTMLLTAAPASGWAQRMIKVSGTVYNIADKKKKVPFSGSVVYVYSCKTVAAAKDLKNSPTRMRIISTVNTSMWEMSSMAPFSMS